MTKYLLLLIFLLTSIDLFPQANQQVRKENHPKLVGRWKGVMLRMTDEKDTSQTIQINLLDPKSVKWFSDTLWYGGLFGKLKARGDRSLEAKKAVRQASMLFKDMDNTYVTFKPNGTYSLNNQRTLFGFAANGRVFTTLTGRKYSLRESQLIEDQNTLVFNVAKGDDKDYAIVKLSNDTLIIDMAWRDIGEKPIKEITFKKQ
jgi:hypothetical protein